MTEGAFPFTDDDLAARLGRDLPFALNIYRSRQGTSHTMITAQWILDHGQRPYNQIPFRGRLAFVDPDQRDRYFSGFVGKYVAPAFQGLGLNHVFMRNAMPLFREAGDTTIQLNAESSGAKVAQQMGFLAASRELDLNDDEHAVFGEDWTPDRVWMSHGDQCRELHRRVDVYEAAGLITAAQATDIRTCLKPDEPDAILQFLDMPTCIPMQHFRIASCSLFFLPKYRDVNPEDYADIKQMIADGKTDKVLERLESGRWQYKEDIGKTIKLSTALMDELKVATTFNTASNHQLARFAQETANTVVDKTRFEAVRTAYIRNLRRQYANENSWLNVR